jgi:hypothetical protein
MDSLGRSKLVLRPPKDCLQAWELQKACTSQLVKRGSVEEPGHFLFLQPLARLGGGVHWGLVQVQKPVVPLLGGLFFLNFLKICCIAEVFDGGIKRLRKKTGFVYLSLALLPFFPQWYLPPPLRQLHFSFRWPSVHGLLFYSWKHSWIHSSSVPVSHSLQVLLPASQPT